MKKFPILLVVFFSIFMLQCTSDKRPRVLERPVYGLQNSQTLEINKVELTDSSTILYIDAYFPAGNWIRIDSGTYIQADGEKYPIRGSENVVLQEYHWMPESGEDHFALIFPALPKGTKSIDFIESDCDDCFKIWDVDLTGKAKKYTPLLPSDILYFKPDKSVKLPDPKFAIEQTNVKIYLRGMKEGFVPKIALFINDIASQENVSQTPVQTGEGEYLFRFDQYSSVNAILVINNNMMQMLIEPGETAEVYFDVAAFSRYNSRYHPQPDMIYAGFRGKFANINNELFRVDEDAYDFSLLENEADILEIDPADFADYILKNYTEKLNDFSQHDWPEDYKQFITTQLKVNVLDCILSKAHRYERAYRTKNNISSRDAIDYDIPQVSDEDLKKLSTLNLNDPSAIYHNTFLLIAYYLARSYSLDQINKMTGTTSGFLQDIYKTSQAFDALNLKNSQEEARVSLESVSNPFFVKLFDYVADKNKREYEAVLSKGGFEIRQIPDVKTDKIIDAIIDQYKGKLVFIDYWATWCGPCLNAMNVIKSIKPEMKDLGVVSVYISNSSSPKNKWMLMLPEIGGIHYYLDDEQWKAVSEKYNIRGIPTYMLFDKNGKKVYEATGYPGNDKVLEEIKKVL